MKKILVALSALLVLSSCVINVGNKGKHVVCKGPVQEKTLELAGFDKIHVNGHSDLILSQGESFAVKVNANEEVFDYLDFHVDGSTLVMETLDHVQLRAKTFKVYVTLPCLKGLTVNGAVDAELKGYHSDENLDVLVNGAGDFDLCDIKVPVLAFQVNGAGDLNVTNMDVDELAVIVNGAGDAKLSGKAGKASFSVSGAADIDAMELECAEISKHKGGIASIRTR